MSLPAMRIGGIQCDMGVFTTALSSARWQPPSSTRVVYTCKDFALCRVVRHARPLSLYTTILVGACVLFALSTS
jgi:hypothetical protein